MLAWLKEPAHPGTMRNEFLLKLFFSGTADPSTVVNQLRDQVTRHQARLETYRAIDRSLRPAARANRILRFQWYTLYLGLLHEETYLTWLERVLASIESDRLPDAPGGGGAS